MENNAIPPKSSRYMCSILENMRKCIKTLNFSYLMALIEEAQYRAERMESAIEDIGGFERIERQRIELKKEISELEEKIKDLQPE